MAQRLQGFCFGNCRRRALLSGANAQQGMEAHQRNTFQRRATQPEFTSVYAPDVQVSKGILQPDFSSVIPSNPDPKPVPVVAIPAAPVDVVEYGLCINGISTGIDEQPLYRFADYYSAVQYGLGLKMYGYSVSIFQITNGIVDPFSTFL